MLDPPRKEEPLGTASMTFSQTRCPSVNTLITDSTEGCCYLFLWKLPKRFVG